MAKTKIKLRPDQTAVVISADGTYETYLHEQPEDADATRANLMAAFCAFALQSTPLEAMDALIKGLAEDDSSVEIGVQDGSELAELAAAQVQAEDEEEVFGEILDFYPEEDED